MPLRYRNLMWILLLGGAAIGAWFLARSPAGPARGSAARSAPEMGYSFENAAFVGRNEQGDILYRIVANRIDEATADEDVLHFTRVELQYADADEVPWDVGAASAEAPREASFLDLVGGVVLESRQEGDAMPLKIETPSMRLDAEAYLATSSEPTRVVTGRTLMEGVGFSIHLKENRFELESGCMAVSLKKTLLATAALAACMEGFAQNESDGDQSDAIIGFDNFSLDREANVMRFSGFKLTKDNMSLSADSATAHGEEIELDDGEWKLEGHVRIAVDSMVITGESASFLFQDQDLIRGELIGNPVVFEDIDPAGEGPVEGSSKKIVYDNRERTVRLIGDVKLKRPRLETTWCDLVYFLDDGRVNSGPTDCQVTGQMRLQVPPSEPVKNGSPSP